MGRRWPVRVQQIYAVLRMYMRLQLRFWGRHKWLFFLDLLCPIIVLPYFFCYPAFVDLAPAFTPLYPGWPTYDTSDPVDLATFFPDVPSFWAAPGDKTDPELFNRLVGCIVDGIDVRGYKGVLRVLPTEAALTAKVNRSTGILDRTYDDDVNWQLPEEGNNSVAFVLHPTGYTLRMRYYEIPSILDQSPPEWSPSITYLTYLSEPVVGMQILLEKCYASAAAGSNFTVNIRGARYLPRTPLTRSDVWSLRFQNRILRFILPASVIFPYAMSIIVSVGLLVQHREAGFEAFLKVNGMVPGVRTLAFALSFVLPRFPITVASSIVISQEILPVPLLYPLGVLTLNLVALVFFAFTLSCLFRNRLYSIMGTIAVIWLSVVAVIMTHITPPGASPDLRYPCNLRSYWWVFALLFPTSATGHCFASLVTLANPSNDIHEQCGAPFPAAVGLLIASIPFHHIVYRYLDAVRHKGKPFLYFLSLSEWRKPRPPRMGHYEEGIEISGLRVEYRNQEIIRDLTLNVSIGEVVVLLGANGAGKSTTLKVLASTVAPAGGSTLFNGMLPRDVCRARSVGYCPQSTELIPNLTVEEILRLVAEIKGTPFSESRAFAAKWAKDAGLFDTLRSYPSDLSLGQKRALSVAIAFIGRPRMVLLDEPTSGLDPASQRYVWKSIERNKRTCATLFTTHLLDEAELLADRIAVLKNGTLLPGHVGTVDELRKSFKCGHRLVVTMTDPEVPVKPILQEFVQRNLPETLQTVTASTEGRLLYITLPPERIGMYAEVFRALESSVNTALYGIETFSVETASLDNILTTITAVDSAEVRRSSTDRNDQIAGSDDERESPFVNNSMRLPPVVFENAKFCSVLRQIWIMIWYKRLRATVKHPRQNLVLLVPVILALFGGLLIKKPFKGGSEEGVWLSADLLRDPGLPESTVYYSTPYENATLADAWVKGLQRRWPGAAQFHRYNGTAPPLYGAIPAPSVCLLQVTSITEEDVNVTVHFNASFNHLLPTVVSILWQTARQEDNSVTLGPSNLLPYPSAMLPVRINKFFVSLYLGTALLLMSTQCAGNLAHEKGCGARHLQMLCGVYDTTFFLGTGLGDLVLCLVSNILVLFALLILIPSLAEVAGKAIVLFTLYVPAMLACNYSLCYRVTSKFQGVVRTTWVHVFILYCIGDIFPSFPLRYYYKIAPLVYLISPTYGLVDFFTFASNHYGEREFNKASGGLTIDDLFILNVNVMTSYLIIWVIALVCCESGYKLKNLVKRCFPRPALYYDQKALLAGLRPDKAVRHEALIVRNDFEGDTVDDTALYANQVRKMYSPTAGVGGLYLKLTAGTFFGLLGPSGSGKSTALKLLAGLSPPGRGETRVKGLCNLHPIQLKGLHKKVGYCPQTDPLPEGMTVHEVVLYYALLRGVSRANQVVDSLLEHTGIAKHKDKPCNECSGGARRMVSLVIAVLGNPEILILDEPTNGMDVMRKAQAHRLVTQFKLNDRDNITVLSTHSVGEVEALCTRIGIMQSGYLVNLGTPTEVKAQHSVGYHLRITGRGSHLTPSHLADYFRSHFQGVEVLESLGISCHLKLPHGSPIGGIVQRLEDLLRQGTLVGYALSDASFERAYLMMVQKQLMADGGMLQTGRQPPLRVIILVVGSRGDVQPFIALSLGLQKVGHTVCIATHPCFKSFVEGYGIEFSSIGGDPERLMKFMVQNPSMVTLNLEEIRSKRQDLWEIYNGCWGACQAFSPNVVISNPPVQVHVHIAEKLQVPLQIHFTMPWSPTEMYTHPLAVVSAFGNVQSYGIVEDLLWLGTYDIVNNFREKIGLRRISFGSGLAHKVRVPHVYCISDELVPRPSDWGSHITMAGFWFLPDDPSMERYEPPPDLDRFLATGPPPVYIGFGSIVVPDIRVLDEAVFGAIETLQNSLLSPRFIVSSGWARLGESRPEMDGVYVLQGSCPHDWLFPRCSAVVHHGGAGTTATGLRHGKPSVVVSFFGDQYFWGSCCHRMGVGPAPIPFKELKAPLLAEAIREATQMRCQKAASILALQLKAEDGVAKGVDAFHQYLGIYWENGVAKWPCEAFENQRWFPLVGWTSQLTIGDPPPWSDASGMVLCDLNKFPLPPGWRWEGEWKVNITGGDEEGFVYGTEFRVPCSPESFRITQQKTHFIRRRKWQRVRVWEDPQEVTKKPQMDEVERLRLENALLRQKVEEQHQVIQKMACKADWGRTVAGEEVEIEMEPLAAQDAEYVTSPPHGLRVPLQVQTNVVVENLQNTEWTRDLDCQVVS